MGSGHTVPGGSLFGDRLRRRFGLIPRSLGTRLALTYTGLTLAIMVVLGWSLAVTIRNFYFAQLETELSEEAVLVGSFLDQEFSRGAGSEAIVSEVNRLGAALGARVTVITADGRVLGDSARDPASLDNHGGRPEIQAALQTGEGSAVRTSDTMDEPYFFVARSVAGGEAVVRLGIPLDAINSLVQEIQREVIAAALLAAVLMTGAGLYVAQLIADSLRDIRKQAAAVAAGQLDTSIRPAPTRELGDLGRAINLMTGQLRGAVAELERVRARLEATLANLSDGVVITDDRGHVILANDAATHMLAASRGVIGEPLVEVARDHELADLVNQALTGDAGTAEKVIRHGRSGRVLQSAARRLDAADERIGVVVLRDVTELRRLEGMRRDFVANVSHELRTPLTSIRALVETLESGAIDDPEVSTDFLARIVSEVDRLALLVDELLDLARLESGRTRLTLERVDPESLIRSAIERMAPQVERARLTIDFAVAPGTPQIIVDRSRVDQVLLNLIHNAVKFTPSGGTISMFAAPSGQFVEFRVSDTGVGVNSEELPRLFERFYKADRARRSQGTGLGLAISKHIVQAHGGSIWAEANQGPGTVFIFAIPVAGPSITEESAEGDPAEDSANRAVT